MRSHALMYRRCADDLDDPGFGYGPDRVAERLDRPRRALGGIGFAPLENRCAAEKPLAIAAETGTNRYEPARSDEWPIRLICGDFRRFRLV
jgi:hypothetical protein